MPCVYLPGPAPAVTIRNNYLCERIEQLHQMGDLGDMKPSGLLASMAELCPHGHEGQKVLSVPVSTEVARHAAGSPRKRRESGTARSGDQGRQAAGHAFLQAGQVFDTVEAVEDSGPVAAVHQGQRGQDDGRRDRFNNGRGVIAPGPPAAVARSSSGLCHFHWKFDHNAYHRTAQHCCSILLYLGPVHNGS